MANQAERDELFKILMSFDRDARSNVLMYLYGAIEGSDQGFKALQRAILTEKEYIRSSRVSAE
jgi:hypothetical protein